MSIDRMKDRQMVPIYVQEVSIIGAIPSDVYTRLSQRQIKIRCFDYTTTQTMHESVREATDCIIYLVDDKSLMLFPSVLKEFQRILEPNGRITILFREVDQAVVNALNLSDYGWIRYHEGHLGSEDNCSTVSGITVVRDTYCPVTHASLVSEQGRPDFALAILDEIPEEYTVANKDLLRVISDKQRYFLTWQQQFKGYASDHLFFAREHREFGQATSIAPDFVESYHIHSQFLSHIGRNDLALRTLRSIEYVCPQELTRDMIRTLESQPNTVPSASIEELPANGWQDGWHVPRILIIANDCSDYGLDSLYHGLCTLIGKENIVEYPWKPTLHGKNFEDAQGYPCVFDYPGAAQSIDDLVLQLQAGCFDFILYSDVVKMEHREAVSRLMSAVSDIPVIVYDTWDDCYTPMAVILEYLGRSKVDLVFKREMLAGIDYGANTYPLPFGYQENLAQPAIHSSKRNSSIPFWAGKKMFGLRPLYNRYLEKRAWNPFDIRLSQSEYQQKLRSSSVGLCFFGFGFDSVRYWEVPANGVMLLAERPPILIPNNFEDAVSAVFFDDLSDMESKLDYYLNRPDEAAEIAANGYTHFLKYHTTTARARLFLGIIYKHLSNKRLLQ